MKDILLMVREVFQIRELKCYMGKRKGNHNYCYGTHTKNKKHGLISFFQGSDSKSVGNNETGFGKGQEENSLKMTRTAICIFRIQKKLKSLLQL